MYNEAIEGTIFFKTLEFHKNIINNYFFSDFKWLMQT